MEKQKTSPPTAKPAGISLYDRHREYLRLKAKELTKETGEPVSASKVNQMLIDEAMKKEARNDPLT